MYMRTALDVFPASKGLIFKDRIVFWKPCFFNTHSMNGAVILLGRVGSFGELLTRPCVDCGLTTGSFCDFCFAKDRMPEDVWAEGQRTPFCTRCDGAHEMCHYCRGQAWCVPAPRH